MDVNRESMAVNVMMTLVSLGSLVNVYCLFTYIGDLDATNCACARDKQRMMHYFLYIWRWILVVTLVIGLMCAVLGGCKGGSM
jgi:hypothetical protein